MNLLECIEKRIKEGKPGYADFNKPESEWPKYRPKRWEDGRWFAPTHKISTGSIAGLYNDGDHEIFGNTATDWSEYTEQRKPVVVEFEADIPSQFNILFQNIQNALARNFGDKHIKRVKVRVEEIIK